MTSPDLPPLPDAEIAIWGAPDSDQRDEIVRRAFTEDQLRAVPLAAYRAGMLAAAQIAEDTEAGDGSHDYNAGAGTMQERIDAAIRRAAAPGCEGGAAP